MTDDLQHTRTELILCIFLGWLGAHRFYARKYGTAIIYLLTMGVFCIGWIRDIIVLARRYFSLKKGGSTVEVVVSEEAIAQAVAREMLANMGVSEPSEEWKAASRERQHLADEGREERKRRMAELGLDVAIFTDDMVREDVLSILDNFSPAWDVLRVSVDDAEIVGDFQNLTKTGKMPKNVFDGQYSIDGAPTVPNGPRDMVMVTVRYLKDASVNMADAHLWTNNICIGYSVRLVDGEYRITSITRNDLNTGVQDTLYLDNAPKERETAMAILNKEIRKSGGFANVPVAGVADCTW